MIFPRSSGILLHPTSLPGRYGIGDLGEWAYKFVDYLESAGQSIWQLLPLGPTSYGDSPYQSLSAFAGNPNLISLDKVAEVGWLSAADLSDVPNFPAHEVDYGPVIDYHNTKLHLAWENFKANGTSAHKEAFAFWRAEQASWLDDFALFAALKNSFGGKPWVEWEDKGTALHQPEALLLAKQRLADEIDEQCFRQWVFFEQWSALKMYANSKAIRLVGDIPIFVAHDSSDVWANKHLYYLDDAGNPLVVAGVPPDYFSVTGQRWGNPLYRWDVMAQEGYRWWIARFRASLSLVDIIRVDHFRGFEAYWEVPASEPTAVLGRWVPGPQDDFFNAMIAALGSLPIIAEDLGLVTEGVVRLRDKYGLPGMKVLQFAFGTSDDGEDPFLPHNHVPNCVVYTGTHDNNTTVGWWQSGEADKESRRRLKRYIGHDIEQPHWELIRLGMASVAHTFVMPMQDVLGFGAETRMNTPGKLGGNWAWRFTPEWFDHKSRERLARWTRFFYRWTAPQPHAANG